MFHYFLGVARRCGEQILDGKPVGFGDRLLYGLGDLLVYAPLRNRMGFSRTRVAYTAGEAIGPELFRFYRSLGINLKQLYGQTEASVYITHAARRRGLSRHRRQAGARTCRSKSPTAARCCSRAPACSSSITRTTRRPRETKTPDGWVHTGDAGFFDQRGHLKIIDRAKDVGASTTARCSRRSTSRTASSSIPRCARRSPSARAATTSRMFINIDPISVGNWAERNNVSYASYQELAGHPQV